MKKSISLIKVFFITLITIYISKRLYAVPESFLKINTGNMKDVQWNLIQRNNVQVYFDEKAFDMGRYSLLSIEEAYPYLSSLLGVKVGTTAKNFQTNGEYLNSSFPNIVLILGDRTEGPGFANPVTQNIESQMIGPRNAAFFQHELVHRLMYEHNDIHIGAPGRIFSLAMMPTWWIEGLAEYLTESVGHLKTQGILRSMSLQKYWPTWETLHALYNAEGDANLRGYVTSGQFLGWIFSKTNEKSLYKIQEEIAKETIKPFFYDASDTWLNKNLNDSGVNLYSKFKNEEEVKWTKYLNGLPSLLVEKKQDNIFAEKFPLSFYTDGDQFLISKLTPQISPIQSSFISSINNQIETKNTRLPLSIHGSTIFAVEGSNNSEFVTTKLQNFYNSSYGYNLLIVKFKGNVFKLENKNIVSQKTVPFSSKEHPYIIDKIFSAGNNEYYLDVTLKGNSFIYLFNSDTNKIKMISEFPFPIHPKFIGLLPENSIKGSEKCLVAIIDSDREETSLHQYCPNGINKELLKKNKLYIQDGYISKNNYITLLASWDKVLSLVHLKGSNITPIAAFPDWITGITPQDDDGKVISAWVYEYGKYHLDTFNLEKVKSNFEIWQSHHSKNSPFSKFPLTVEYQAPFKKIYAQKMNSKNIELAETTFKKLNPEKAENIPAPYDHNFLFAFPYAMPGFFGGPSINIAAIPYQDKMQRDQITMFGGYHFYLKAPMGNISYINRRIFDGFVISAFATPFFNGIYKELQNNSTTSYYNYLLQQGVSIGTIFNILPRNFYLNQLITISSLEPYANLKTPPTSVGAQKVTLLGVSEQLRLNLFRTSFYIGKSTETNGDNLLWRVDMSLTGGKFYGLKSAQDAYGADAGTIDYYKVKTSLMSTMRYQKQTLTLGGSLSTTQGPGTFNLREFYSPYNADTIASSRESEMSSLSYFNIPFAASISMFDITMGKWKQEGSLIYEFPIFGNAESLFLMSYINDWKALAAFSEGGTTDKTSPINFNPTTSITGGIECTVDVKGFQIFPSLSYTQLLDKHGWGVLMQVKFTDFM